MMIMPFVIFCIKDMAKQFLAKLFQQKILRFKMRVECGSADIRAERSAYPEKVYACVGNCDYASPLPVEGELEIERVKILYCHGHTYGVKSGLARLAMEAKKRGCDVVFYGHTHRADITQINGVTLINPGSFRYPTNAGGGYAYVVINGEKVTPVLVGEGVL